MITENMKISLKVSFLNNSDQRKKIKFPSMKNNRGHVFKDVRCKI